MLSTAEGTAECVVSDPDPWGRYRISGISTPPFAVAPEGAGIAEPTLDDDGRQQVPAQVTVAIIGAGFGGLGAGIRLRQAGLTDFVILERAGAVGGTWRDNSYPGCGCDVPSHLYSYSFAPNPGWSRSFSPQPEIWQYLNDVADRYRLRGHLRLSAEVTRAQWDPAAALWRVDTSRGSLTATILISAAGPLSEPAVPDIPGLDSFPGPVFHSARWDHETDLAGLRVAVIGTGASAIQLVPAVQPVVSRLTLFQRTPAWVLPRRDRRITSPERALFRRIPAAQRLARLLIYLGRESTVGAFTRWPGALRAVQRVAAAHLARSIRDPRLRASLTPDYVLGCKRVLLSDDFYPALARPNVQVIGAGLASVEGATLTAQDGTAAEADVIVFATGFQVTDMPIAHRLFGGNGLSLAESWHGDMAALRGTTVAGFPNLCLVIGPNTGLGHTSMIFMIESQLRYIEEYVTAVVRLDGRAALDVRADAQDRWNDSVQRRMARTVWATGGCRSWYLNAAGRNPVLWPASTLAFRRATRRLDLAEYRVIAAETGPAEPRVPVSAHLTC
ncbi:MAG: NAD(P)-binding domain-containing protein [Actinobacteria bacterium]|nr:NAD(P)-binding domain-containing protein [Actinomycetota bacterium]